MKNFKTLLLSASTLMVLAACGPTAEDAPVEEDPTVEEPVVETPADDTAEETSTDISLSELGDYDGQDGNPGYVAVDGIVYDVTDNEAWAGGVHMDDFPAGHDYTEEILESPHGESVLENLEVVGNLVD